MLTIDREAASYQRLKITCCDLDDWRTFLL